MVDEAGQGEITALLAQIQREEGSEKARARLFQLINDELRRVARGLMRHERADHTLQGTALVNEAYLRLSRVARGASDRRELFGALNRTMRQLLVEHARKKKAIKRGGAGTGDEGDGDGVKSTSGEKKPVREAWKRQPLDIVLEQFEAKNHVAFPDLEEALERLEREAPEQHQIVMLRFFSGLSFPQIAGMCEMPESRADQLWRLARAKLFLWLRSDTGPAK